MLSSATPRATLHHPLTVAAPRKYLPAYHALGGNRNCDAAILRFHAPIALQRAIFRIGGSGFFHIFKLAAHNAGERRAVSTRRPRNEPRDFWMLQRMAVRAKHLYVGRVERAVTVFAAMLDMVAVKIFHTSASLAFPHGFHDAERQVIFGVASPRHATLPSWMLCATRPRCGLATRWRTEDHFPLTVEGAFENHAAELARPDFIGGSPSWLSDIGASHGARNGAAARMSAVPFEQFPAYCAI